MYKYNLLYCFIILIILYFIFNIINYQLSIKKMITNENFDNNTIPKIIIQTWKSNNIPTKYKNDISSLKKHNPSYEYKFFSDEDIDIFMKKNYPELFKTYQKFPVVIQKIDFFRYVAVYHFGGFYFDLDMLCFEPLDDILQYDSVFPIDLHMNNKRCNKDARFKNYCDKNIKFMVGQYAFGAKPKDRFVKTLIDIIHNNIDDYIKEYNIIKDIKRKKVQHQYIYSTTGPDFVTNVYIKYDDKKNIHILDYPQDQFFGKYAKHNHFGTWK
jgi:mannosyltransferase OCH1-like enzyme